MTRFLFFRCCPTRGRSDNGAHREALNEKRCDMALLDKESWSTIECSTDADCPSTSYCGVANNKKRYCCVEATTPSSTLHDILETHDVDPMR